MSILARNKKNQNLVFETNYALTDFVLKLRKRTFAQLDPSFSHVARHQGAAINFSSLETLKAEK